MKKRILILLVIVSLIILSGCTKSITNIRDNNMAEEANKTTVDDKTENKKDREYIVDERAYELFSKLYQINNLKDHEAYITDDTLNISLWFNNNVKRQEIMKSKDYVMSIIVLRTPAIGAVPYCQVLGPKYDYDKVKFTAYIEDTEILQQDFSRLRRGNGSVKIDYYENLDIEHPSRIINDKELKKFARKIKWRYWSIKDVIFEKTYKGNVLAVKLKGRKEYKEDDIIKIKQLIEESLAPKSDHLGIVLQLYSNDKKYYEEAYHNNDSSNKKYWFKEYWGNHDYFDFDN